MRILLTNDDGIHAEGLGVLERIARQLSDDVWVVAPENDQSGLAHSLTLSEPLRLRKIDDRHFALRGTPTDCVIMGLRHLLPEPPDLVLSGVNSGANMADDVTYSGTVAGAMEGTLHGVPSIALSQEGVYSAEGRLMPWDVAEEHGAAVIKKLLESKWNAGVFMNVNFPNCIDRNVKGIRVTAQGKLAHDVKLEERLDGRGFSYFWLRFGRSQAEPVIDTDVDALNNDYISVTPLQMDLTAYTLLKDLDTSVGTDF